MRHAARGAHDGANVPETVLAVWFARKYTVSAPLRKRVNISPAAENGSRRAFDASGSPSAATAAFVFSGMCRHGGTASAA